MMSFALVIGFIVTVGIVSLTIIGLLP